MSYKAVNTFIDDLFAFVVKMPLLHRIGCLRDDLVFLIFLYQKWIYPVDKARVNEYGQYFEETSENQVTGGTEEEGPVNEMQTYGTTKNKGTARAEVDDDLRTALRNALRVVRSDPPASLPNEEQNDDNSDGVSDSDIGGGEKPANSSTLELQTGAPSDLRYRSKRQGNGHVNKG